MFTQILVKHLPSSLPVMIFSRLTINTQGLIITDEGFSFSHIVPLEIPVSHFDPYWRRFFDIKTSYLSDLINYSTGERFDSLTLFFTANSLEVVWDNTVSFIYPVQILPAIDDINSTIYLFKNQTGLNQCTNCPDCNDFKNSVNSKHCMRRDLV